MSNAVPEGWSVGTLTDLSDINPRLAQRSEMSADTPVSFIKMEDVSNNAVVRNVRTASYGQVSKGFTSFQNGDVLVAKITPCFENGKGGFVHGLRNGVGFGSTEFYVFRARKNSSPKFLYQFTNSEDFRIKGAANMTGSAGQRRVPTEYLKSLDVAFPPLPEQQKIATILSSVDDVIEKTRAQIDKLKDLKTGMMQELLTKGIGSGGVPHSEFKDSPVGKIPKNWEITAVETLLSDSQYPMRSGPFGSSLLKKELIDQGIPLLGIDNVHVEHFRTSFKRFVTREKFEELKRYAVFPGDVMVTIMGTVGRCCVVPEGVGKALSSKHVWTITLDSEKYIPDLLCWQINFANWVEQQFKNESQGGVMDSISSRTLKRLIVPVPPMDEQVEIANVYRSLIKCIKEKQSKLSALEHLKKALMQDLLTGKVRVSHTNV